MNNDRQLNIDEELQKNKILKGVDTDKKHQHEKLMDEFRKAHRKMFKNDAAKEESDSEKTSNSEKEQPVTVSRYFN